MKAKLLVIIGCLFMINPFFHAFACQRACGGMYIYSPGNCGIGYAAYGSGGSDCYSCQSIAPYQTCSLESYVQSRFMGNYNCSCLDPACDYPNRCITRATCCHVYGNIGDAHFEDFYDP